MPRSIARRVSTAAKHALLKRTKKKQLEQEIRELQNQIRIVGGSVNGDLKHAQEYRQKAILATQKNQKKDVKWMDRLGGSAQERAWKAISEKEQVRKSLRRKVKQMIAIAVKK